MPFEKPTPRDTTPPTEEPKKKRFFGRLFDEDFDEGGEDRETHKSQEPLCSKDDLVEPKGCEHCRFGPNGNKRCSSWLTKPVAKAPYTLVQFDGQDKKRKLGSHTFFPISESSYIIIYDDANEPVCRLKPFPISADGSQ